MAAAIGAGLPVTEPIGSMVVDIGGGTTEVGVLSLRGLAYSRSARVGGDRMDEAIASYIRRKHNLMIGESTAERVKLEIGSAGAAGRRPRADRVVRGRDVGRGNPKEIEVSQAEIADALRRAGQPDGRSRARRAREDPARNRRRVIDQGIMMTGGGSLLRDRRWCFRIDRAAGARRGQSDDLRGAGRRADARGPGVSRGADPGLGVSTDVKIIWLRTARPARPAGHFRSSGSSNPPPADTIEPSFAA